MRNKAFGLLILLVGSEVIGVILGNVFFQLFGKTVPPAALNDFNKNTAHVAFITYGLVAGLFIFVWATAAALTSRFFRR